MDDAALFDALSRTPPRSAQVVMRLGLDGWTLPQVAERYGVDSRGAAALVLQSLRDLHAAVDGRSTPASPLPDAEEKRLAEKLAHALDTFGAPPSPPAQAPAPLPSASPEAPRPTDALGTPQAASAGGAGSGPDAAPAGLPPPIDSETGAVHLLHLRALTQHKEAVRRRLVEAEEAAARSPARARETWLRRLAIIAILALSAWFYWKEQHKPPQPPPPAHRPLTPGGT